MKRKTRKVKRVSATCVAKPYRTLGRPMGLRNGLSLDNVSELVAMAEGERHK